MDETVLMLDTNCWVDYYVPSRRHADDSRALIRHAFQYDIKLAYPACIAKDVFYLIAADTKRFVRESSGSLTEHEAALINESAWSAVNHMRENAFAVSIGQTDVWYAAKMRSVHNDFEDNLVLAAAEKANATYLVTNDEQLIKHAPIAALTPHDALVYLKARME